MREAVRLSRTQLCVLALAGACATGGCEDPVPPPVPTTIEVSPVMATLESFAETVQLTATVRDEHGQVMSGVSLAWTTGAAGVATVSSAGLVTAVGNGTAMVEARTEEVSGTAVVTVEQRPAEVEVTTPARTRWRRSGTRCG